MKIFKESTQIIASAILFVVFPIVAFILVTSKTPILLGIRSFVVLTGSMEPTVATGSIIFTKPGKSYEDGEIIAFKSGDLNVTHRIVKAQDGSGKKVSFLASPLGSQIGGDISYQTKGDANKTPDGKLVSKNQVLGKALFHIPLVGRLVVALKTPLGFLMLLGLPTLLFIGFELWNIKNEIEKNMERKFKERMGMT